MLQKLVDFKIEVNSWLHIIHPFKVFSEYLCSCVVLKSIIFVSGLLLKLCYAHTCRTQNVLLNTKYLLSTLEPSKNEKKSSKRMKKRQGKRY